DLAAAPRARARRRAGDPDPAGALVGMMLHDTEGRSLPTFESSPPGPPLGVAARSPRCSPPHAGSATRPVAPEVRLPGVWGVAVEEPNRRGHRSSEPTRVELLLAATLALAACGRAREPQLFESLSPERTGVTF